MARTYLLLLGLLGAATIAWMGLDGRVQALALQTMWLSGTVTLLSLPLGTLLAVLLTRTRVLAPRLAWFVLAWLVLVPLFLQAGAWQSAFGLQGWFPLQGWGSAWLQGWIGAVTVHTAVAIPWVTLLVGLGLWQVEPELEEQALLSGTPWHVFGRVTIWRAAPSWGVAALWILLTCATEITVTDLFRIRTLAEVVYNELAATGDPSVVWEQLGPGLCIGTWLATGALMLCSTWLDLPLAAPRRPRLPWTQHWLIPTMVVWSLLSVLLLLPLCSLIYQAGVTVTPTSAGLVRGWSPLKTIELSVAAWVQWSADGRLMPGRFLAELSWSGGVSALVATSVVSVAVLAIAWCDAGLGGRATSTAGQASSGTLRQSFLFWSAALALAIPAPLVGLAVIVALNQPDWPVLLWLYDRSIFAVWLVQSWRGWPFAVLLLWPALRSVPTETMELAQLDGLGPLRTWLLVRLPQRFAALGLAWLVVFSVSLGELGATMLVTPPGLNLLSVRIFNLLHAGVDDLVAAVYLSLLAISAGLAAIAVWLVPRALQQSREMGNTK